MYKLSEYATIMTRGRKIFENPPLYRTEFQRDRDRIIHSSAFRRLEYKTQVFVNHQGDMSRTRLTHSLEVAQIGRSIAYALNLNIDLVEAICLAHDLGHTPFGHTGQEILNSCVKDYGGNGFEHNLQSLRIVDDLEEKYPNFKGLNLTFETREGILKHCSLINATKLGDVGERFIKKLNPSLEAQLANIADELAYNYHDMDDGLRAKLITIEQLKEIEVINQQIKEIQVKYPRLEGRLLEKELVRELINITIYDLINSTKNNIREHGVNSYKDIATAPVLVKYSAEMSLQQKKLKKFLMKNMYNHYNIRQLRFKVKNIIKYLFEAYYNNEELLPDEFRRILIDRGKLQTVTDYICGMTDRYAYRQYAKLFNIEAI